MAIAPTQAAGPRPAPSAPARPPPPPPPPRVSSPPRPIAPTTAAPTSATPGAPASLATPSGAGAPQTNTAQPAPANPPKQSTASRIGNVFRHARDSIGHAATEAKDALGHAATETKDALGHAATATKDKLGQAATATKERVGRAATAARDGLNHAGHEIGTRLSNSPRDIRFTEGTQGFRDGLGQAQRGDPSALKQYGYDPAAGKPPPAPGSLWIDPQFVKGSALPNGQVTQSQFPVNKPVTEPPKPMDVAFANGKPYQYTGVDGKPRTANTPDEYRAQIAEARRATGMPRTDGEPIGAHMVFQGGGGVGKRYGEVINQLAAAGVVPVEASGTSAGAITAGFVAAGATPQQLREIAQSDALGNMKDWNLTHMNGGLADGDRAYQFFDQKLRDITGIKDRPVLFSDLKMPLHITATLNSDSQRPAGEGPLARDNRAFVFSQETTPNTPVALAMRSSMAINGFFDPVQAVDPTTGRRIQLTDGGVIDNLPMNNGHKNVPTLGISPVYPEDTNPANHQGKTWSPPKGNLNVGWLPTNAVDGYRLYHNAGNADWRERTNPGPNQFMLGVPSWNLNDQREQDSMMDFTYHKGMDDRLDVQTREATQRFLRNTLGDLGTNPNARYTNQSTTLPARQQFSHQLDLPGASGALGMPSMPRGRYNVAYDSANGDGRTVQLTPANGGKPFTVQLPKQLMDSIRMDDNNFPGASKAGLLKAITDYMNAQNRNAALWGMPRF